MNQNGRAESVSFNAIIEQLARTPQLLEFGPEIARIILSIRLQALYARQCEDPLPDLAVRLESVSLAGMVLEFTSCVERFWPEPVCVGRMGCQFLSHDEATLAGIFSSAREADKRQFVQHVEGLVRMDRQDVLWDRAVRMSPWL